MKQQLRAALLPKKFLKLSPKWLLVVVLALLCLGVAMPLAAQTGSAQLRVGHFVFDAPAVNLYVDEAAVAGHDAHASVFGSMTLPSQYLTFAAGAHTFAVARDGDALTAAIIHDQSYTLEADHDYLLAILGNAAAKDLHFKLIDETTALAKMDVTKSAVTIDINNIYGIPAIDALFAGKPYFTNLAYGDYVVSQDPTEGQGTKVTAYNDPASVILEVPEAVGSPGNILAVFVFSGKFPGNFGEDFTAFYVGQYIGKLSITDAGSIAVGDSVPVNITGMGQRVQYALTLKTKTTLDIVQAANDVTTGADAYLRINNAAGNTLYENDELSMTDNAQGVFDAGWHNLVLDAGTYTLEASTLADTGSGLFTLSVKASP